MASLVSIEEDSSRLMRLSLKFSSVARWWYVSVVGSSINEPTPKITPATKTELSPALSVNETMNGVMMLPMLLSASMAPDPDDLTRSGKL
jgi:hypothetical protein